MRAPLIHNAKMETKEEIVKVNGVVLELLRTDERCRNCDKWLTYLVMRRFTKIYIPFEDFKKIPAFETIKRCRAKIQNVDKMFIPTDIKVLNKRQRREKVFKEVFKA
jgi:hypothetical protein